MDNTIDLPPDNDELEIISNRDVIPVPDGSPEDAVKRIVAEAMKRGGIKRLLPEANGSKETTYVDWLSTMVWDGIVEGTIVFADGTPMQIKDDPKTWIGLVKFLSAHLDGAVNPNSPAGNINFFKVYVGVDPNKL
jgi:hypothetical protein